MKLPSVAFTGPQLFLLASLHLADPCSASPDSTVAMDRRDVEAPSRSDNDNICNFFRHEVPDPLDSHKTIWQATFPDASRQQCVNICGEAVAKARAEGEIGSTTCYGYGDLDWQPCYGESTFHLHWEFSSDGSS